MEFDEEKWRAIEAEWLEDDNKEAADELESGADAMALADPKTWAESDLSQRGARGISGAAATATRLPRLNPAETSGDGDRVSLAPQVQPPVSASLSTPRNPKSMDWKQLRDALQNAQMRANQSRSGESLRANAGEIGAYRPDFGGSQGQVAQARIPLDVAKEKQGFEAREQATGVKAAMDNPHSLQSQKAREAWRSFGLTMPPGFDNWTANDIQRNVGAAQAERTAKAHASNLAAKSAEAQAKAKSDAQKAEADRLMDERRLTEQERHNRESEQVGWAAAGRAKEKTDNAKSQDIPPGFEVTPGANPGPDSRKKFTALVASQQRLKRLTAKMRKMMAGAGRADRVLDRDALNQLATEIGIEGKNVAELGALSGPDMGLMEAMVQNPTTAWNIFRDSDVGKNMDGLDSWANESVSAGSEAYGIRPVGGGAEEPTVTLTHGDGRSKRVKKSVADAFMKAHPGKATIK